MTFFLDSHCHPQYLFEQNQQLQAADFLNKCFETLSAIMMVSVSLDDFDKLHPLALLDPRAHMSVGIHPSHAHEEVLGDYIQKLRELSAVSEVKALGETGLDYYHDQQHKIVQQSLFEAHLELAASLSKPVIVHTRNAPADTLSILKNHPRVQGVIHCFTETKEFAKEVLDLNWMISFSGIVTFKNALELREVVQYVPDRLILSETDAPYLAPVPFRGKENQPVYVQYVTECLAALKNKTVHEMAATIEYNYQNFLKGIWH